MYKMLLLSFLFPCAVFSQNNMSDTGEIPLMPFEKIQVTKADSGRLLVTWNLLRKSLKNNDDNGIKRMCLEKLDCWNCNEGLPGIISVDSFVAFYNSLLKQDWFVTMLSKKNFTVSKTKFPEGKDGSYSEFIGNKVISEIIYIYERHRSDGIINLEYYSFLFVEKKGEYAFLGLNIRK